MRMLFSPFTYVLIYVAMWYLRLHEYPDSPIQFPILTVLQAIAVSLWVVRTPRRLDVSHLWLLLMLLLSMFVSTITNGWAGGVIEVFNLFVPTILVFVMIAGTADSLKRLNLLAWTIALSLSVIAVHGILESQTGVGWSGATVVEDTRITYVGLLGDPNDLAMALLMALPMQVYLLSTTRRLLPRLLLLTGIGAVLWSTYLTNSRGAVLGLAAMLTWLSYRRYGLNRTLLIAPLLLVALVVGGPGRIDDMSADEDSAAGRVDAWYAGFEMFRERPLFGVGMGNFVEHNWLTAHNSFVLAMAELGTVGYFLWLALLATSIVMIRRIMTFDWGSAQPLPVSELSEWRAHQRFASALLYTLIAYTVTAFFLSRSYVPILYMTYGLCAALDMIVRKRWPAVPPVRLGLLWPKFVLLEIGSIVALRLTVSLLL
jgi:putative inorganic carbon (hco3(-)) transporter